MAMDDVAFAAGSSSASMDAFAESSANANAPTDPSHGWQKVVYPKRNRKHAAPSAAPTSAALDLARPNVFEGVDKRSQERHRAIQAARDAAEADGSIAAWADDGSDSDASNEAARPQAEEVKKPKKPKVKKPKVTVADAAALIDAENLAAHLVDVSV